MSVVTEPPPLEVLFATTLSGRRIHYIRPPPHHQLTLCRKVVYEVVGTEQARGRAICKMCEDKL